MISVILIWLLVIALVIIITVCLIGMFGGADGAEGIVMIPIAVVALICVLGHIGTNGYIDKHPEEIPEKYVTSCIEVPWKTEDLGEQQVQLIFWKDEEGLMSVVSIQEQFGYIAKEDAKFYEICSEGYARGGFYVTAKRALTDRPVNLNKKED